MSVRPQTIFLDFNEVWHVGLGSLMSYARWYAVPVWPDPRWSRSRALESWKSCHFQKLSPPPPFTMAASNWPRILKY